MQDNNYNQSNINQKGGKGRTYAQFNAFAQFSNIKTKEKAKKELLITSLVIGATTLAMVIIQTVLILAAELMFPDAYNKMIASAAGYYLFSAFTVHICSLLIPFGIMSIILKKMYITPLVPRKRVTGAFACAWVAFGMGCCMLANYVVVIASVIAEQSGYKLTQSETPQVNSAFDCIAEIISVVIAPALIEEFALRCCTLGALRKYGKGFSVLFVSIMFGLIHGNIIQFIFATLVGIILGFITVKTDNVYIAVIVHGCNNGLSVISDVVGYALSNSTAGNSIASAAMMVWLALSLIGLVYLIYNKELFCRYPNIPKAYRKQYKMQQNAILESSPYHINVIEKMLLCLPGFLLYAPFYIYAIIKTIVTI